MIFRDKVFELVKQIPGGRVTTYKNIAHALGTKGYRAIGQALHSNTDPRIVPCHRVVHTDGTLSKGYAFGGEGVQRRKLIEERVSMIEGKIDFSKNKPYIFNK